MSATASTETGSASWLRLSRASRAEPVRNACGAATTYARGSSSSPRRLWTARSAITWPLTPPSPISALPGLTAEQAAMAEPVSVGIWAARKGAITGGDRVLITGAGPIGLLAGQVARALGADTPVITDVSDFRLARARDLGLRTAQAGTPLEEEFDVLLECSGAPAALTEGMRALAPAGRVALVGMGADTVTLDVALVQGRELSVTGVFRYANTYPLALQLISSGAVNVTDV